MVDSGIKPTKECVDALVGMDKIAKSAFDYIICELKDIPGKKNAYEVAVKTTKDKGSSVTDFEGEDLGSVHAVFKGVQDAIKRDHETDGCYVLFYLYYTLEGNREQSKLVLLTWAPDSGAMRKRMLISSTAKSLIKKCPSGAIAVTRNSIEDLTYKSFVTEVSQNKK